MTIQIETDIAQLIVIAGFSYLLVKALVSQLVSRKPRRKKPTKTSTKSEG